MCGSPVAPARERVDSDRPAPRRRECGILPRRSNASTLRSRCALATALLPGSPPTLAALLAPARLGDQHSKLCVLRGAAYRHTRPTSRASHLIVQPRHAQCDAVARALIPRRRPNDVSNRARFLPRTSTPPSPRPRRLRCGQSPPWATPFDASRRSDCISNSAPARRARPRHRKLTGASHQSSSSISR